MHLGCIQAEFSYLINNSLVIYLPPYSESDIHSLFTALRCKITLMGLQNTDLMSGDLYIMMQISEFCLSYNSGNTPSMSDQLPFLVPSCRGQHRPRNMPHLQKQMCSSSYYENSILANNYIMSPCVATMPHADVYFSVSHGQREGYANLGTCCLLSCLLTQLKGAFMLQWKNE